VELMAGSHTQVERIVSGGQTGVDRVALDVALELGIAHGGWCPAARWAEDGVIPARYRLTETESSDPAERTRCNVRDSDGTLVLGDPQQSPGTALTTREAERLGRPVLIVSTAAGAGPSQVESVRAWLREHRVRVLNVAGPRASESTRLGDVTRLLRDALAPE